MKFASVSDNRALEKIVIDPRYLYNDMIKKRYGCDGLLAARAEVVERGKAKKAVSPLRVQARFLLVTSRTFQNNKI